ncbi:MAG: protein kinase [Anaerolineae bacterium]|nr:protein kinase [Anaerolineae bacterium]
MPDKMIGKVINDYCITNFISSGGMAIVYKAAHITRGWPVAVKMILPDPNRSEAEKKRFTEQFDKEADLAKKLGDNHNGLVTVYNFGYFEGDKSNPYIMMQYLEGNDLSKVIDRLHHSQKYQQEWLHLKDIIGMITKICETLDYIHTQEIDGKHVVHRDIKPANVMFRLKKGQIDYLQPVIMDLGVAELTGESRGFNGGTVGYAAPEMLASQKKVDGRADIYAAGVMLFELCTGRRPFEGNRDWVLYQTVNENPPSPSKFEKSLPPSLEKVILKALQRDPHNRYATAGEMAAALKGLSLSGYNKSATISLADIAHKLNTPPGPHIKYDPNKFDVPEAVENIIRQLFINHKEVNIQEQFGEGRSGAYVYGVKIIQQDGSNQIEKVIKVAAKSLIEKEYNAYLKYVKNFIEQHAKVTDEPVYHSGWGAMAFVMSEGGLFNVKSLAKACFKFDEDELSRFSSRLYKIMSMPWGNRFKKEERTASISADFVRLLPVDLFIEYRELKGKSTHKLTPDSGLTDVKREDSVRLEKFIVVKEDLIDKTITLKPRDGRYYLRVKFNSQEDAEKDMQSFLGHKPGDVLKKTISGVVKKTRESQLIELVRDNVGREWLKQQWLNVDDKPLPSPLYMIDPLLELQVIIPITLVHGDINWENILINLETGHITLIDFAEAGHKHILVDLLRYETEAITKFVAPLVDEYKLDPIKTIDAFYTLLDRETFGLSSKKVLNSSLPKSLKRPFEMLKKHRKEAEGYLDNNFSLYYQLLTLHLVGAMKFDTLDKTAKVVAFWAAAVTAQWTGVQPKSVEKDVTIVIRPRPIPLWKRLIAKETVLPPIWNIYFKVVIAVCTCLLLVVIIWILPYILVGPRGIISVTPPTKEPSHLPPPPLMCPERMEKISGSKDFCGYPEPISYAQYNECVGSPIACSLPCSGQDEEHKCSQDTVSRETEFEKNIEEHSNNPVKMLTWADAQLYCEKFLDQPLNRFEVRLPTEDELRDIYAQVCSSTKCDDIPFEWIVEDKSGIITSTNKVIGHPPDVNSDIREVEFTQSDVVFRCVSNINQ